MASFTWLPANTDPAQVPFNDAARLQSLRDLAILDTAAEESFDELTRTAALVCQMPIALISLVDEHRQWFKSKVGLDANEAPREYAFCDHAIRSRHELMEVPDATCDPRFRDNPLVTGAPEIRFYAGAPLVNTDGQALGTLCVIDRRPRHLEDWQREVLANLARQVVRILTARSVVQRDQTSRIRRAITTVDSLMQQVPSGAVAIGAHERLQINAAACAILQIEPASVPNLTRWFEKLFGARAAEVRALYDADRAAGFTAPRQVWLTRGDGAGRLVEFHGMNTAHGELWLMRDVTDTSGAEERFRVLFEHSSDAHLLFDETGIIDCNRAAIAMLGCHDKSQVLSLHPAKLSPELQPDGRRSEEKCIEMDRLAREKGFHRFEWMHRKMDGTDFIVEVSLTPVELHGDPVLLVVWHDLTERNQAEKIERERERRWLLALEASGDGVWDWNMESNRVYFSPRWKAMLGYDDQDIGDDLKEWKCRVHPEDLDQVLDGIQRHFAGEIAQYTNEHRVLCKDGSWKWILDRGMVVERHDDGRPRRMIGTHIDLTERRTMENELRTERERFRAISDASPMGIYTTDVHGRATYVNEQWLAITGLTNAAALDDGWVTALHHDDRERVFALWNESVASGKVFSAEYRFRRPDGKMAWVHGMAAPMQVAGKVVGYVGSIADITERHDAEERLVESIHRFDLVVAGAAIGIWETRFTAADWLDQLNPTLPVYWSPRLVEMIGYTADEFPGCMQSWWDILHPEDRESVETALHRTLAIGVPYNVEYRMLHKDGSYRWYHATGEVERDAKGRPCRFAGSMADITQRKNDQQLVESTRVQLTDAISNLDAGLAMFDADDRLVICNQQYGFMYGLSREHMSAGTSFRDLIAQQLRSAMQPNSNNMEADWLAHRELMRLGTVSSVFDREFQTKKRWIRIAERPTTNGGVVSLHTDVTALKRATEEMARARDLAEIAGRAKADFLATMSHELRTPMNGVIGMTTLLLDTSLTPQQKEFAETARLCGDQLLALINDILDFSKIEAGSLQLEKIPFSPRRLAEDAIALVADQAEKKGLQVVCLIGADVPGRLLGDPTRLRQVILNLLSNAIKFTEKGEVVLSIATPSTLANADSPGSIELAVRDSGIGIPAAAQERLFKPFSQADSSTTRKFGGTGLGLVICQRLLHLMHGTIELSSQVGLGSTFTCRLSLEVVPEVVAETQNDGLVGRHALVVGASATARRALREQCIGWGMSCAEAVNPLTLAASVAARRPEVLIIDHEKSTNGIDLGRELANGPATAGIPVILIVASAHRGMAAAAQQAGISAFLTRPVRHDQLFNCLLVVFDQCCRVSDSPSRHLAAVMPLVTKHSLEEERAPRRVLVVEDNPVNRQVAVMMLSKIGCRCDVATNGQEAVDAVARQDYHVVFMDCQMPVLDGYGATAEIRRREAGQRRVRIIALTANAMNGDRDRCLAAGMDDYVTKPIKAGDLAAALERAEQARQQAVAVQSLAPLAPPANVGMPTSAVPMVIDDEALSSLLAATDQETLQSVAKMMHDDGLAAVVELQQAVRSGDAVTLGRTAHRLKGASGTVGLRQIQNLCISIEKLGRAKQLDEARIFVEMLDQAMGESLAALAKHPLIAGAP